MTQNQLICLNDGQVTTRNSNSIIDLALTTQTTYKKSLECNTLTHEYAKSDHIGIYVKLHSCIRDRPFNLKGGGGYGFLLHSEFIFQNLTLGNMTKTQNQIIFFFLHQIQNIFFRPEALRSL